MTSAFVRSCTPGYTARPISFLRVLRGEILRYASFFALYALLAAQPEALAQYSQAAFDLKKASELYDERGFLNGSSINVDGNLAVSNTNGNVGYSYPIASMVQSGYGIDISLNYCGSVAFSAFKEYNDNITSVAYARWNRFHQNRPAWLLSVNGFCVQMLSSVTMFHANPSRIGDTARTTFNNADMVWLADGYDFSNRMTDFAREGNAQEGYIDRICLLRGDGSLLELYNKSAASQQHPGTRCDLYTGHYFVPEANSSAFAVVDYDTTRWLPAAKRLVDTLIGYGPDRCRYMPRILRYYPGDGLEYVFREWTTPYGMRAYRGANISIPLRYGSMTAGPTIFYLEEINSNAGPLIAPIRRARQYWPRDVVTLNGGNIFDPIFTAIEDSTVGRAVVTGIGPVRVGYGSNAMVIEAYGRTTKVQFDSVVASGNAPANTKTMPMAERGHFTATAAALAKLDQETVAAGPLYENYLGYVTAIIDAEGRATRFEYEPYSRTYTNYGFPRVAPSGGAVKVSARNMRLKTVRELDMTQRITYARGSLTRNGPAFHEDTVRAGEMVATVTAGNDFETYPYLRTNVASVIRAYDPTGALLTEQSSEFLNDPDDGFYNSRVTMTDAVTGHRRATVHDYRVHRLPDSIRWVPRPRYTELYHVWDSSAVVATSATLHQQMPHSPYVWLPVRDSSTVAGLPKSRVSYAYTFDTVRTFGGKASLAALLGTEVRRKVSTVHDPATGAALLHDTAEFTWLPLVDTTLTRLDTLLNKFATLENYFRLRDSGVILGPWEWAMFDPRVAVFTLDSTAGRQTLPPHYGLPARSVLADSAGAVLGGSIQRYTGPDGASGYLHDLLFRGRLEQDSTIGAGGITRPGDLIGYTRGVGLNVPRRIESPNGSVAQYFHEAYNALKLRRPSGAYEAHASVLRNDGTTKDSLLPHNGYFSVHFNKPLVEEKWVRRYDPATGALTVDTLIELNQYGFFGLETGSVDANGNFTSAVHDHNGRLLTLHQPGDFARTDTADTVQYQARETIGLAGYTKRHYTLDTVRCDLNGALHAGTSHTTALDVLYAGHGVADVPECPCPPDTLAAREKDRGGNGRGGKDRGARPQANCNVHIPFVNNDYFDGQVPYTVDSASPVLAATALDSAFLELHPTAITGECVTLVVKAHLNGAPLAFTKTFVFNCGQLPNGGNRTRDDKRERAGLLSGGIGDGFTLKVDLDTIKSTLLALQAGDILEFFLTSPTAGGGITFVSGVDAEDTRPALVLKGTFDRPTALQDYTLAFTHDDDLLRTTETAKIDDIATTMNRYDPAAVAGSTIRRFSRTHHFGADGRVLRTLAPVREDWGGTRTDSVVQTYSGLGAELSERDETGAIVSTEYDAAGRAVRTINADSTVTTMAYEYGTEATFGLAEYCYGFVQKTTATDENGVRTATYADAFGRVRREVTDEGDSTHLNLTTRYSYDLQGRLTAAVNPKGDSTRYWYDAWGNVSARSQPDLGLVSYAYDAGGNVRFVQSQSQADDDLVEFNQYDDLDRLTLAGVAQFSANYNEDSMNVWLHQLKAKKRDGHTVAGALPPGIQRRTEGLDPDRLHTGTDTSILTANRTLWMNPARAVPAVLPDFSIRANCALPPNPLLGETEAPTLPAIMRPAAFYHAATGIAADTSDFEHVALYPEFVRTAVAYDTLPTPAGAVWGAFPAKADWDAIAPRGAVRNQRGRESAVAWRERGCEPFHYAVVSYDERGRAEALLRYTENLGFDVVYYTWNALNEVTSITQADYLRQHTTWYGYDAQGRVDSVWSQLSGLGGGLWRNFMIQRATHQDRPDTADIVYRYTKRGRLDSIAYPAANVRVAYAYHRRGWLDSLVATRSGGDLFRQILARDAAGQIMRQIWRHDTLDRHEQRYTYDAADRLTAWTDGPEGGAAGNGTTDSIAYSYNAVGGRTATTRNGQAAGAYLYGNTNLFSGTNNQLIDYLATPAFGNDLRTQYVYTADGAVSYRHRQEENGGLVVLTLDAEETGYSYRDLARRHRRLDAQGLPVADWRYRYGAAGEREQKRLYAASVDGVPQPDSAALLPWVYYLLGGDKEQLAVYHGSQTSAPMCGDTGRRVYMYPTEYITHGVEYNGVHEDIGQLVLRPDGTKEVRLLDHLASLRVSLIGDSIRRHDYDPWGVALGLEPGRRGFNSRERDPETGLFNLGVRRYDAADAGAFTSVDPLWEKYRGQTPYQYANNNPLAYTDPDGKQGRAVHQSKEFTEGGAGGGSSPLNEMGPSDRKRPMTPARIPQSRSSKSPDPSVLRNPHSPESRALAERRAQAPKAAASGAVRPSAVRGARATAGAAKGASSVKGETAIYRSISKGGKVQYVGITKNIARRAAQHMRTKGITIELVTKVSNRALARSVEQALINRHGLSRNGGNLMNKINSISPSSPTYSSRVQQGIDILKSIGYR